MICDTTHNLHIVENGQRKNIPHLKADQTRVLVGVSINLCHNDKQIVAIFDEKIQCYTNKLATSTLKPGDIMFGYQHY